MIKVLVALEFAPGRFSKVLTARLCKEGRGTIAKKWHGSVESYVARSAAKYLGTESAASEMFYEIGSKKYRVTRI